MEYLMPPQSEAKTVLIVEDDPLFLLSLSRTVQKAGFEVITATTAVQALKMVNAGAKIDLIVSDLRMPRMDGLELRDQLATSKTAGVAAIPFVFLSGLVEDSDREVAHGLGVRHFLQKPVDLSALVSLARELTRFVPSAASETWPGGWARAANG